jgi:hypothetical protein
MAREDIASKLVCSYSQQRVRSWGVGHHLREIHLAHVAWLPSVLQHKRPILEFC